MPRQRRLGTEALPPEAARRGQWLFSIYTVATAKPMPSIDLDVYFNFNSAAIKSEAEPQLRELGAALTDSRLKGATISHRRGRRLCLQPKIVGAPCHRHQTVFGGQFSATLNKFARG